MRKVYYRCYECEQLSEKIGMAYDYKGGDYSRCLKCGAIEPGFEEVIEETFENCRVTHDLKEILRLEGRHDS